MTRRFKILNIEPFNFCSSAAEALGEVADVDARELQRGELLDCIGDYDALITRLQHQIDTEVFSAGKRLLAVSSATTGLDHIDLEAAARHGVAVLSLRGEVDFLKSIYATAEHTWGLLLGLMRRIPWAHHDVLVHHWERDKFRGRELHGQTLGVIGHGRLGEKVARYGSAFGMRVLAYDPFVTSLPADVQRCESLEDLLSESDVVTIHVPLQAATRHLIGAPELAAMRPGGLLINTSRGGVIDETALVDALVSGHLAGAALDVLQDESTLNADSPHPLIVYAQRHDNLLITPHLGGATLESMNKTEVFMAQKLREHLSRTQWKPRKAG